MATPEDSNVVVSVWVSYCDNKQLWDVLRWYHQLSGYQYPDYNQKFASQDANSQLDTGQAAVARTGVEQPWPEHREHVL